MNLQAMIDAMNEQDCRARSSYHLTLGELHHVLLEAPDDAEVVFEGGDGVGSFDSYRGYYIDIAIDDGPAPTVKAFRERTETALETVFEGYKGGDFPASPDKPLWRAEYGDASGMAIVAASLSGERLILKTKQVG